MANHSSTAFREHSRRGGRSTCHHQSFKLPGVHRGRQAVFFRKSTKPQDWICWSTFLWGSLCISASKRGVDFPMPVCRLALHCIWFSSETIFWCRLATFTQCSNEISSLQGIETFGFDMIMDIYLLMLPPLERGDYFRCTFVPAFSERFRISGIAWSRGAQSQGNRKMLSKGDKWYCQTYFQTGEK